MDLNETAPVLVAIRAWLDAEDVAYREVSHPPARTCEESARARSEPLSIGGKCLLLKAGDEFGLFALSAALTLDSRRLRRSLGTRRLRFATEAELLEMTGLSPGCLPPVGEPILPFPLHVDESIQQNERIAFNAGSLSHSIILSTEDYLRIAQPRVLSYSMADPRTSRGEAKTSGRD